MARTMPATPSSPMERCSIEPAAFRAHEQLADPLLQRADPAHVAIKRVEQLVVGSHRFH